MAARSEDLIRSLQLEPLGPEGGWFRETFRDTCKLSKGSLPEGFKSDRSFSTCIYYLLTLGQVSWFHRLISAEVWHFYLGRPLILTELMPDGSLTQTTLGSDLAAGQVVQHTVLPGTWFGAHVDDSSGSETKGPFAALQKDSDCSLIGATVAPGNHVLQLRLGSPLPPHCRCVAVQAGTLYM
ncbi:hypothetical protein WJX73_007454 [Symbiochloris irregularis]|uniref:DUF985 domain-containing protein n=1 Tax=Symbiochloris irregularis TaxID=706552 RepID=A0AAW1PS29_9CHLO